MRTQGKRRRANASGGPLYDLLERVNAHLSDMKHVSAWPKLLKVKATIVNELGARVSNPGSPIVISRRVVAVAYERDGDVWEHKFKVKTPLIGLPNHGLYMPPAP